MGEVSFSQLCAWQVLLLLHWVMNWTWHNRDMWVAISDNLPLLIPPMGANQSSKFLSVDMLWCIQSLVTLGSLYMSLKGISAKYVYRWMCVWIAGGVDYFCTTETYQHAVQCVAGRYCSVPLGYLCWWCWVCLTTWYSSFLCLQVLYCMAQLLWGKGNCYWFPLVFAIASPPPACRRVLTHCILICCSGKEMQFKCQGMVIKCSSP